MNLFHLCPELNCNRKYKTKVKLVNHLLEIHKIIADDIQDPVEITKENKKNIENKKNTVKQSEKRELLIKEIEIKRQLELKAKEEAEELYKQQQIEKYNLIELEKIRLQDEKLKLEQINFEKFKLLEEEKLNKLADDQSEKKAICSICFDSDANAAVVPCGHSTFCYECISSHHVNNQNKVCPICRTEIVMIIKLYT